MASTINASTAGVGGVITTADNSGILNIQTAGTTAITVNASQNVGVGVTPSPWVGYKVMQAGLGSFAGGSSGAYLISDNAYTDNSGAGWKYINSSYAPAQYYAASGAHVWRTAPSGTAGNAITFTQAMTLDASGNLLVGTTTNVDGVRGNFLHSANANVIRAANSVGSGEMYCGFFQFVGRAPNDTASQFITCNDSSATRFVVRGNGGIANYSANNVNLSDERVKKDIVDAGSYIDKICAIPVRTFLYKDQTDDELNLGVIAQEVEAVAPELVDVSGFGETPEDGVPLKAIYQTDLQYALMKCIQEQQQIITDLQESLTNLTSRLEALEGVK